MKKLVLLLFFIFISGTFGQSKFSAGILIGGNFPGSINYYEKSTAGSNIKLSSEDNEKVKPNIALNILYAATKNINIGVELEANDVRSISNYAVGFIGQYLFPLSKITPYLNASVGYNIYNGKIPFVNQEQTISGLIYNLGAGLQIPIAKKINIDVRILYKNLELNLPDPYDLTVGTERIYNYKALYKTVNTSLGLNFNF